MDGAERVRLTQLLEQDADAFFTKALSVLRSPDQSERLKDFLRILIGEDLLVELLRRRTDISAKEIGEILRAAMALQPSVDLKLARDVCDRRHQLPVDTVLRLVDALIAVSSPARISSIMLPLIRDADVRVCSKAALLVNISDDERAWAHAEQDPRVLANAIEALWDLDCPQRRARFWKAVNSSNPRVAGNALVGLFRIGDREAGEFLIRMCAHDSAEFRRTAAWVMGETGNPQYLPVLTEMLKRESGAVRVNVLRSLTRLRNRAAGRPASCPVVLS